MSEVPAPNPGSDAAYARGCLCPILDNNHGRGNGPFWMIHTCPLHGYAMDVPKPKKAKK